MLEREKINLLIQQLSLEELEKVLKQLKKEFTPPKYRRTNYYSIWNGSLKDAAVYDFFNNDFYSTLEVEKQLETQKPVKITDEAVSCALSALKPLELSDEDKITMLRKNNCYALNL